MISGDPVFVRLGRTHANVLSVEYELVSLSRCRKRARPGVGRLGLQGHARARGRARPECTRRLFAGRDRRGDIPDGAARRGAPNPGVRRDARGARRSTRPRRPMTTSTQTDLLSRLAAIVGPGHLLTDPADLAPYLREPREKYAGRARCVVRPKTRDEVAAILALCHETGTPLVPQGGNTGLVGGQTPYDAAEVVLSMHPDGPRCARSTRSSNTMTVEAGLDPAGCAQQRADAADRLFPLSLAAPSGSCTIGGNLSSNAGGTTVAGATAWRARWRQRPRSGAGRRARICRTALSKLKKDNTGYDLKQSSSSAPKARWASSPRQRPETRFRSRARWKPPMSRRGNRRRMRSKLLDHRASREAAGDDRPAFELIADASRSISASVDGVRHPRSARQQAMPGTC